MKAGLSLSQLAAELERQGKAKRDYVVDPRHMEMVPDAGGDGVALRLADVGAVGLNKLAHNQVAEHLDIPAKYYNRMLDVRPDLLARNVNTWLQASKSPRMVRTLDGKARAFLSDSYRPLENDELAAAVLPVLMDLDVEIMSSEITESRMYIKAVHRSIRKDMPVHARGSQWGDGSHVIFRTQSPGIVISNSETGCGAVSVETSIFDHVCTNLAVFGQHSMKQRHVGARHALAGANVVHMLSDEARRATDQALWLQVRDVVRGAFDELQFGARVDKIAELDECRIDGKVEKVIEAAAKVVSLSTVETASVLRHFIEGGQLSALGVFNAVTRTAQDLGDYDRASELERMGGKLVELPRSQWREIAKAA